MELRPLGKTGLDVSRLGVGTSEIGYQLEASQASTAADVLNAALDAGINLIDTAACYSISEELIGQAVSHRRDEFVLATKAGHAVDDGESSWTAETVTRSIERSLRRLRTDRLDIVQLHSCGVDVLERGEVIEALQQARDAGKIRFLGYSGDNDAALWAVRSGHFDTLQTSFSLLEQSPLAELFPLVQEKQMGVIIKRPIANAAWGASSSPSGYADEYFRRYQKMAQDGPLPGAPDDRIALALAVGIEPLR